MDKQINSQLNKNADSASSENHSGAELNQKLRRWVPLGLAVLCAVCILLNLLGAKAATILNLPLFLDSIGTMFAAALGGGLPGVFVGYATNIINGFSDPINMYYGICNVLIALVTTIFFRRSFISLKRPGMLLLTIVIYSLIGGALGSVITWLLFGFSFGTGISAPLANFFYNTGMASKFWAQFAADMLIDFFDKTVSVAFLLLMISVVPKKIRRIFEIYTESERYLIDAPAMMREVFDSGVESIRADKGKRNIFRQKSLSLRAKVLLLLVIASVLIGISAGIISFNLYKESEVAGRTGIGEGVATVAAKIVNGDEVDDYLSGDYDENSYELTFIRLKDLRDNVPDVANLHVLAIKEEGTFVVFDMDSPTHEALPLGSQAMLSDKHAKLYNDFLSGKPIPNITRKSSEGEYYSITRQVFDSGNNCVAYVIVDISTLEMHAEISEFMIKVISLFFGVFLLIFAVSLRLAEIGVTHPINEMAEAAGAFAYDSEEARDENVVKINELEIHTGDEIENLYYAIAKTTRDTMGYIEDVNEKNRIIMKMQTGLILVLADMVEGRDQDTGDHVRKTAAYVGVIAKELQREGRFPDILTDEYIEDIIASAPLHDIGKISVPDRVLNKNGKLDDDEYEIMKSHTTAGAEIINRAITEVSEGTGYLQEAANLAHYHHEKWDGSGYPEHLKKEEIPLSARIMAVADVFDALVSRRCYKKPLSYDVAIGIIKDGAGKHFDPEVVRAFLSIEDQVREIADMNMREQDLKDDEN